MYSRSMRLSIRFLMSLDDAGNFSWARTSPIRSRWSTVFLAFMIRTTAASIKYSLSLLTESCVFFLSSVVSFIVMFVIRILRWFDVKDALNRNRSRGPTVRRTFCFFRGESDGGAGLPLSAVASWTWSILRRTLVPSRPMLRDWRTRVSSPRSSMPVLFDISSIVRPAPSSPSSFWKHSSTRDCGRFTNSSFGAAHLGNVAFTTQFPREYCQAIRLPWYLLS
mmetsp:Transcript_33879/g.76148  ORF Transcript_33879/g.76148 Transcript_33879/m.76148 type:complete len:222 (-) Transcript_33879:856-1521(-)